MNKKRMVGRPSKKSKAMMEDIILLISSSANGLETICLKNKHLPHAATVRHWIATDKEFRDRYLRAKEIQADVIADEILDISDKVARSNKLSHEMVNAARLRVDSRKWVAARLKPKYYGDKTDVTTNGKDVNTPAPVILMSVEKMTDEQIQQFLKQQNDRTNHEGI